MNPQGGAEKDAFIWGPEQSAKLCQETNMNWVDLLPLALFCLRCTPHGTLKLFPFEMLFGRPPPLIRPNGGNIRELGRLQLRESIQALGKTVQELQKNVQEKRPLPITRVHHFTPGQSVWLKDWKREDLQPKWTGPHVILLASPLGVKLEGIKPWVHHTRIKPACEQTYEQWSVTPNPNNPLQVKIKKTPVTANPAC